MIDKYLEKLDKVLNFKKSLESEELQIKSAQYQKIKKLPIMLSTFDDMSKVRNPIFVDWPVFGYREIYNDPEKMLLDELLPIYESAVIGDDRVNVIRANYGVGIIPSLFGFEIVQKGNDLPWVKPVGSIEEIKKIINKGLPDFNNGLVPRINETQEYYKNKLSKYPNLKKCIHIGLMDNQGPFNLAGIMLGEQLYFYLYSHKDVIKEFLELLTTVYIEFSKKQKQLIEKPLAIDYYFGCLLQSGVKISEDYGLSISPDMYEEFCMPLNEKIGQVFNGFTLLVCEDLEEKRAKSLLKTKNLKGLIYWSKNINKLEEIYKIAKEKKIYIIWYGILPKEKINLFPTGVILKHQIKSMEEALIAKNF